MKFKPRHAVGFQHIDKFQNEIVDGLIKKKAIRDSGLGEIRKNWKSAKNFW
jgi:hypothetical protein